MSQPRRALPEGTESVLLFNFLTALLKNDPAAPGFRGAFAIGVRGTDHTAWWRAVFADHAFTEIVDRRPEDADAWLILSPEEAIGLMTGEIKDVSDDAFNGDHKLLLRFVGRYLEQQSLLGTRGKRTDKNGAKS